MSDKQDSDALKSSAAPSPSGAIGNAAKLREALKHVEKIAREFACGNYYISDFPKMLFDAIRPALSAPPSNCDVGTPEEQYARFVAMCHSNVDLSGRCRESCPFRHVSAGYCDRAECYAKWAQMPYEGGAK